MRAAIYARVSTHDQADRGTSLETQVAEGLKKAAKLGWEVLPEHIIQEDWTGKDLERPGIRRLFELRATGAIDGVTFHTLDRLYRPENDGDEWRVFEVLERLQQAGLQVAWVDTTIPTEGPLASIFMFLDSWRSGRERRQIVERTVRGMVRRADQGKMLYTLPELGYTWTEINPVTGRKGPGGEPRVRAEDVPWVQLIFERVEGMSLRRVAFSVNEEGYRFRSRDGKLRPFRAADILRIVTNPVYTGMMAWGRRARSSHLKGYQPQERHTPELQIISFEQFNRVQQTLKQRHWAPPKSIGSPFLFSGLLKCSRCGAGTVGQRQHKRRRGEAMEWHFYQCRAYHQYGRTACSGQCVSEDVARAAVDSFFAHLLGEELDLSGYLEDAAQELAGDPERIASLKAEIEEAERGMKRLAEAVAAGALDMDAARETTLELRERKERAEKRLAATSSGVELGAELRKALSAVQGDLPGVLASMERGRLKELLRLVFRRLSVEGYGSPRNRTGQVTSYEFTPEFQEFWITHSTSMVGLSGQYSNRPTLLRPDLVPRLRQLLASGS